MIRTADPEIIKIFINPSCTKTFGTPTLYQGGGVAGPPAISNTVAPMNLKFCRVLETSFNVLESCLHSVYLVAIVTPQREVFY